LTYALARDLGIVTSYFNPCGFRARAENFERFVEPIRAAGMPLVVVEACFAGEGEGRLAAHHGSHLVKARDLMWQKERLLDIGAAWLPAHCTKVAWLDADVLFESVDWAVETSERLEAAVVVQPFETAVRLSRGATSPHDGDDVFESFGAVFVHRPEALAYGKYDLHGHTGFAWAARRDPLGRHGLYDACIAGSSDHVMAHTFAGDWATSPCIRKILGRGGRHLAHYRRWSRKVHEDVRGSLSFTPGRLFHLWHGSMEHRRYLQRNKDLLAFGFDPEEDIRISDTGCWEWATDRKDLHEWARRYFSERREDEDTP
jgi:hypothetical protein